MAPPTTGPAAPRVAVVTVSYGSEAVLEDFLNSVPLATKLPVLMVVADNKPETGGSRIIAQAHSASYLPMDSNLGYGGAMNAAIDALPSSVEWVLISNPDVVLGAGSLDELVAAGDGDASIGSVGPAVLTASGDVYPSAREIPSIRTGIGHALFANLWPANPWTQAYKRDDKVARTMRDAGWLSGSCVLVRRAAFDALRGFDTGYFMYFEDVDLGYRLGRAGYRNVYDPDSSVRHTGAHATEGESAAMIAAHHESAKRFLSRKYPGPRRWPLRAALTVGLSVRSWIAQRAKR